MDPLKHRGAKLPAINHTYGKPMVTFVKNKTKQKTNTTTTTQTQDLSKRIPLHYPESMEIFR